MAIFCVCISLTGMVIYNGKPSYLGSHAKVCILDFVVADGLIPRAQRRSTVEGPSFFSRFFASFRMTTKDSSE